MARSQRIVWDFGLYHVTSRGNNKKQTFHERRDFSKCLKFIEECKNKFKFLLYAFVLMPNHIHLLMETTLYGGISDIMKLLNHRYAFWFNRKYEKTGHLWERRFHSRIVDKESYLLGCIRYIELNPVRSKLVTDPKDYHWSSYLFNAYGVTSPILDYHPLFNELGKNPEEIRQNYRNLVQEGLKEIFHPAQTGDTQRNIKKCLTPKLVSNLES